MDLFSVHDFVTSCLSGLENLVLLVYGDVQNDHLFRITFVNITSNLIRKVFQYSGAVKLTVADRSFPKFQFSLVRSYFIIW